MDKDEAKTGLAGVVEGVKGKAKEMTGKVMGDEEVTGRGLEEQKAAAAKRDSAKHAAEADKHQAQAEAKQTEADLREER